MTLTAITILLCVLCATNLASQVIAETTRWRREVERSKAETRRFNYYANINKGLLDRVTGAMPAVAGHPNSRVWLEAGHKRNTAAELRVAFEDIQVTGYGPFWVPLSGADGVALGWLEFEFLTSQDGKGVFAASGWRPASEPAPHSHEILPLPIDPVLHGFAPTAQTKAPEAEPVLAP